LSSWSANRGFYFWLLSCSFSGGTLQLVGLNFYLIFAPKVIGFATGLALCMPSLWLSRRTVCALKVVAGSSFFFQGLSGDSCLRNS